MTRDLERIVRVPKMPTLGGSQRIDLGHVALVQVAYDRWYKNWLECGIVDAAELACVIPHLCREIELGRDDPDLKQEITELEEYVEELERENRDLHIKLEEYE